MNIRKNINETYNLELKPVDQLSSDYFLQAFKPEESGAYFHLILKKKELERGEIFVFVNQERQGMSIPKSPFGGFWIHDSVSSEVIGQMIGFLSECMIEMNVVSLKITQAPNVYGSKSDLIGYLLFCQGFKLEKLLNHQILFGKKKIKNAFQQLFPKLIDKAKKQNFNAVVGNIQSFNFLEQMSQWKIQKGHLSNIDEKRLIQQVSSYPERYFVVSILQESKPVAHAVAVKLTSDSLYYFYSAINPKNQSKHTGELLMVYLLKLAMEQKVSFLDLGSSDLEGSPNHKLMFFKEKYADSWVNKCTWQKIF